MEERDDVKVTTVFLMFDPNSTLVLCGDYKAPSMAGLSLLLSVIKLYPRKEQGEKRAAKEQTVGLPDLMIIDYP